MTRHRSRLTDAACAVAISAMLLGAAGAAGAAGAQAAQSTQTVEPPPSPTFHPNDVPVGDTTRMLLEVQRNGSQAGPQQSMTGEEAAIGYARYMRSFQYPLPEFFSSQSTGSALRGSTGSPAPVGQ
ncbi:uncharacterized protein DUF3613 [Cupriavidus metallidurans]|jgi:Protein of unknown function (DUF3613)|nr:DUF3613 domain-containing protein [Cupriavidus metallidurans]AVA35492.1 DUF3613 domain-containing protein [Cupriavidus metallidurans]KWW35301.1 hypothetical protein AU374_03368 [Cupriavidus metallidurans]